MISAWIAKTTDIIWSLNHNVNLYEGLHFLLPYPDLLSCGVLWLPGICLLVSRISQKVIDIFTYEHCLYVNCECVTLCEELNDDDNDIWTKLCRRIDLSLWTNELDFGIDPDLDMDPGWIFHFSNIGRYDVLGVK